MQLHTLTYAADAGWSSELDPAFDSPNTLMIAFGGACFGDDRRPFDELRQRLPRAHLVGCSTAGEIHGRRVSDDTLTVAIARFERTKVWTTSASVRHASDTFGAGLAVARALDAPGLRAILVFSNGDGGELVRGLNQVIGGRAIIIGGLAGDRTRPDTSWVLNNDRPRSGVVAAVGLFGSALRVGHGAQTGWDPSQAAATSRRDDPHGPMLSIAISCVGRRWVLGDRVEAEAAALLGALPPSAQQIGFYSSGAISPHAAGTCDLHDRAMTLMTLAEDSPEPGGAGM